MALDVNTALATVADVAWELGLVFDDPPSPSQIAQIGAIERLIKAYSDEVTRYLGRPLAYAAAAQERLRGHGKTPRVRVLRTRVYNVARISTNAGATWTAWADIHCGGIDDDGRSGLIYAPCFTRFSGAGSPWIVRQPLYDTEPENIVVEFEGGYRLPGQTVPPIPAYVEELPAIISQAVIAGVVNDYQKSGSGGGSSLAGIKQESLKSYSVTYETGSDFTSAFGVGYTSIGLSIPAQFQHALARYRVIAQA